MPHTLTGKVKLFACTFIALIVYIAVLATFNMRSNIALATHLIEYTLKRTETRAAFNVQLEGAIAAAHLYTLSRSPSDRDEAEQHLAQAEQSLAALAAIEDHRSDVELDKQHLDLQQQHSQTFATGQQLIRELLAAVDAGDAAASASRWDQLEALRREFTQLQRTSSDLDEQDLAQAKHLLQTRNQRSLYVLPISFGLFAIAVLLVALRISKHIVKPIQMLSTAAEQVAQGNFEHEVTTTSRGEIGDLQEAFNQMVVNLRTQQAVREMYENELTRLAFHDALCDLPNRALFLDRVKQALAQAQRQSSAIAVMFLDLDNFKVINDSLGHHTGDNLLVTVAERLQACVRSEDMVARLGGDEFTVLLERVTDVSQVTGIAERIQEQLHAPIILGEHEIITTASIGIAISTGTDARPDALLRDADTAMYRAKAKGKASYQLFDPSMNEQAVERLGLEGDLRRAIKQGEFELHYQPIVRLADRAIVGIEALVRWRHPQRGLMSPAAFIPLAEETGLILPLGQWVLTEACRQMQAWHAQYRSDPPRYISVNLSAQQFQHATLASDLAAILDETGLDPHTLELEITESTIMEQGASTLAILQQLKRLGVRLAIDDFGTGYSSLAYLKRFPIDTLKIDRSFMEGLGRSPEDTAIVHALITLAQTLNLHVTAEGIETSLQYELLQSLACDYGQGYLFSRPLPAEEIEGCAGGDYRLAGAPLAGTESPPVLAPA